jgi:hypothetical protein
MQARSLHSRPYAPRATRARARAAARGVAPASTKNMRPLRGLPRTWRAGDAGPGHAALPHHVPAHRLPGRPVPPLRRLQCAAPHAPPPARKGRAAPLHGVQARLEHMHAASGEHIRQTRAPGGTQGRGTSASAWRRSGRTRSATGARCAALRSPGPGACSPPRGHEARQMRLAAGAQVGTIMLMYIMALAYAASSPIILPFTLAYFIVSW